MHHFKALIALPLITLSLNWPIAPANKHLPTKPTEAGIKIKKIEPIKPLATPIIPEQTEETPIDTTPTETATSQNIAPTGVTVAGCGDNSYANFIYIHESGCRTAAVNAGGCLGIGQACPGSKLTAVCPNLDYACENAFFTDYANRAYGGWAGAYAFWIGHSWW